MHGPDQRPLIAGAGPVGLAAGLFLAQQGVDMRIIDAAPSPSPYSRALAVNPRTLDLLESTGVTAQMLERGMPIQQVHFWRNDKKLATLDLSGIQHRYNFMLALSQAATENLLTEALRALGREVERGTRLTTCRQEHGRVEALLEMGGASYNVAPDWLLAADGARSVVREHLGISFDGTGFLEAWYLSDVPLATDLKFDAGHVWFFDEGGFVFLIPVIDDIHNPPSGDPIWRVLGNMPDMLSRLTRAKPSGIPVWESSFHVSHRIASMLNVGNAYLVGDAAHIHSPIGARGMNLGIEDAWGFAELHRIGRLDRYGKFRYEIDRRVVKSVEMLTTIARGQSLTTRLVRRNLLPLVPHIPFLFRQMASAANGLDHPLLLPV